MPWDSLGLKRAGLLGESQQGIGLQIRAEGLADVTTRTKRHPELEHNLFPSILGIEQLGEPPSLLFTFF